METFVFSNRAKSLTGGFAILGLVLLVLSYFVDGGEGHHMRFWTNLLHNSIFFLGIAAIAGFTLAAFTTAYAGWFVQFKRVWESFTTFLLPAMFLMGIIIVGLFLHSHHLYHWNDEAAVAGDAILTHKSSFLNKGWYVAACVGFVGVWYFFFSRMRQISLDEDVNGTTEYRQFRTYKKYAAIILPIFGFTSAALIWQTVMSMDSHWYSTMFAWYATASWFCAMMALTIMLLIYLKSRGYYAGVNSEHFHDLGKYLFAISIFWTYLWFSQFMLIWYGNVGEETIYFRERMDNYPVLFWANLGLNFLLPFLVLMRNDTKRKAGTLFFVSALVFFGHWLDYFQMIKPSARLTLIEMEAHHGGGHGAEDHATGTHGEDHAGGGDAHHGDVEAGGHDVIEESVGGIPVAHENEEGPAGSDSHGEELATADEAHINYADNAYVQEENVGELEMQGHLEAAGDHAGGDDHTGGADHHGDVEAGGHDVIEERVGGIPVAPENEEGPGDGQPYDEELATSEPANINYADNAYVQEENVDELEMQGHLEAAGDHAGEHHLAYKAGYTLPGLLEIGIMLGFLGGFLFWVLSRLETARLEPTNDPYLEESIHHHT